MVSAKSSRFRVICCLALTKFFYQPISGRDIARMAHNGQLIKQVTVPLQRHGTVFALHNRGLGAPGSEGNPQIP